MYKKYSKPLIVVITCVIFFVLTVLFRNFLSISTFTDVRPGAVMVSICGLLFGFYGAIGCTIGNFLADLVNGIDPLISFVGILIQFSTSYMVYVFWYGKYKVNKGTYPSLDKVSNILKYCIIVLISSLYCAFMIGFLIDMFGYSDMFKTTAVTVFFNQFIFGILLGLPSLALLIKTKLPFVYPRKSKYKNKKIRLIISNSLFLTSLILFTILTIGKFYFKTTLTTVYLVLLGVAIISLFIRPLHACKKTKKNKISFFSINEKMIFIFTIFGVILISILGFLSYLDLKEHNLDIVTLWNKVYTVMSIATFIYFGIAIVFLGYFEKCITFPVIDISNVISRYSSDNYKSSNKKIAKCCSKYNENYSEISEMSNAINNMICDIGTYTEEIRVRTAEREKVKSELNVASKIQLGIVPHNYSDFDKFGIDIYSYMLPAKIVGGDFYDFFLTKENKVAFFIGDVSGKGVPSALFMSMSKLLLNMYILGGNSPANALNKVNKYLCEHNDADMFFTGFVGVYDPNNGNVTYANAGHNPPIIQKDNEVSVLKTSHGFMVGCLDFVKYKDESITLNESDKLILYTDGISESNNINKEFYGEERLIEEVVKCMSLNSKDTVKHITNAVNDFAKNTEQFDDMTMLVIGKDDKTKSKTFKAVKETLDSVIGFVANEIPVSDNYDILKNQIELICEEIFVNICNYSYEDNIGDVKINVSTDEKNITFTFIDSGKKFNPLKKDKPNTHLPLEERQIGGLGIFMVKKLADKISYEYKDKKNILTIVKNFT